ncbi:hypothetical protein DL769_001442 [Monosporascus sp. CRB-8-3]|nr:hypothetical protein DL769_001442 [Monosporascus sp. CRB-8-3]
MLSFSTECWIWYALAWAVVIARLVSRSVLLGSYKRLQADDGLMIIIMIADTVLMVAMNIISTTSSNLIDPNDPVGLTPESIKARVFGSKMVVLVEQMQCVIIWSVKACLLIMYSRLTLAQNFAVKAVAVYVALSFVVMEVLYLGVWCTPFSDYWAVPPSNDIMIIILPMPVFLQSQLPIRKKIILCGIFALGLFTILSAILSKYYSFTKPFDADWTFWYIRESSTAIITANLPLTYSLLQIALKQCGLGSKLSKKRKSERSLRYRSGYGGTRLNSTPRSHERAGFDTSDSQELITKAHGLAPPLQIYQRHEVHVSTSSAGPRNDRLAQQLAIPDSLANTKARGPGPESGGEPSSKGAAVGIVTVCR